MKMKWSLTLLSNSACSWWLWCWSLWPSLLLCLHSSSSLCRPATKRYRTSYVVLYCEEMTHHTSSLQMFVLWLELFDLTFSLLSHFFQILCPCTQQLDTWGNVTSHDVTWYNMTSHDNTQQNAKWNHMIKCGYMITDPRSSPKLSLPSFNSGVL